jgi:predicted tellurium resistance membrane protein TerC
MLEQFLNADAWLSLLTLTILEIVLGIDNIIFLSIITGDLPKEKRPMARRIGLGLALILRIALLFTITLIAQSTKTLFSVFDNDISWRDIIMIGGGLFLLWKSTDEMHELVDLSENEAAHKKKPVRFGMVIVQIALLDLVFSLDSIITAVGMSGQLPVMIGAIIIAILIMLLASGVVSDFINEHPSIKMLALSFIMLVGLTLIADGFDYHIPRGYLYFSISFSLMVEFLNLRAADARKRRDRRDGAS